MQIVIINGAPASGKSSFEDFCVDYLGKECSRFSTIDLPKEIYKIAGWNGDKTPEARATLSRIKDYLYYEADIIWHWVKYELSQIYKIQKCLNIDDNKFIVFISCREPEQIRRFVDEFGACTVFINRKGDDRVFSNDSDRRVKQFSYNFYINNDSTLENLKLEAERFCKIIRGE